VRIERRKVRGANVEAQAYLSRRDYVMVATRLSSPKSWHEMPGPGTTENPSRRVRHDWDEAFVSSWTVNQFFGPRLRPFPTGRVASARFPGISCQATII
jgi:hypothetical protein